MMVLILRTVHFMLRSCPLTADDVLACITDDWTCTTYGDDSLRKRLISTYSLFENELGDADLFALLQQLDLAGHISLETRPWHPAANGLAYLHQQCRRRTTDDLPRTHVDACVDA
jgi:hypothetical protein